MSRFARAGFDAESNFSLPFWVFSTSVRAAGGSDSILYGMPYAGGATDDFTEDRKAASTMSLGRVYIGYA